MAMLARRITLLLLLACALAAASCASRTVRDPISMSEAIGIAESNVTPRPGVTHRASANFSDGEWLVTIEYDTNHIGDFVYVYVTPNGKVRKVQGGY